MMSALRLAAWRRSSLNRVADWIAAVAKRRPCRVGGALEAVDRAGEVGEAASGLVLSAELYGAPPAVGVFMVPD